MTDALLRHNNTYNVGSVEVVNGRFTLADGLETAVYLSCWGGNAEDDGTDATADQQWWGNYSETEPEKQYRSETQALVASIPLTPANMILVQDAVERDLAWMLTYPADAVSVEVTMPARNTMAIAIDITINGDVFSIEFDQYGNRRL